MFAADAASLAEGRYGVSIPMADSWRMCGAVGDADKNVEELSRRCWSWFATGFGTPENRGFVVKDNSGHTHSSGAGATVVAAGTEEQLGAVKADLHGLQPTCHTDKLALNGVQKKHAHTVLPEDLLPEIDKLAGGRDRRAFLTDLALKRSRGANCWLRRTHAAEVAGERKSSEIAKRIRRIAVKVHALPGALT